MSGVQIVCGCCGKIFVMCRKCYKGHAYCSNQCRKAGYQERRRKAQQNYRKKEKGKKQHRNAEARRRRKKKQDKNKNSNTIIDSCICLVMKVKDFLEDTVLLKKKGKCVNCDCNIDNFLEFIDIRT